jgi:PUA domain protein
VKSYILSKKNGNQVVDIINKKWFKNPQFTSKNIRTVEVDNGESLLIGKEFTAVKISNYIIPFLTMKKFLEISGKIVIDKGAVRFICNGANIMRPGVIRVEGPFKIDDIIGAEDAQHGKMLAVGFALANSLDIQDMNKGVVMKNMHYIGDKFWEAFKKVR